MEREIKAIFITETETFSHKGTGRVRVRYQLIDQDGCVGPVQVGDVKAAELVELLEKN